MRIVGVASKGDVRKLRESSKTVGGSSDSPGRAANSSSARSGELSLVRQHAFDDDCTENTSSTLVSGITRGNTLIHSTTTVGTSPAVRSREVATPVSALTEPTMLDSQANHSDYRSNTNNAPWRSDYRRKSMRNLKKSQSMRNLRSPIDSKSMREIVNQKIDQKVDALTQEEEGEEKTSKDEPVKMPATNTAAGLDPKVPRKKSTKPRKSAAVTAPKPKGRKKSPNAASQGSYNSGTDASVGSGSTNNKNNKLDSKEGDKESSSRNIRSRIPYISAVDSTGASSGGGDVNYGSGIEEGEMNSSGKVKMTKIEKIKQLQAKNEKYKEEYKKIYGEKKELKKKLEEKRLEVLSLRKEIDSYVEDTTRLQKELLSSKRTIEESNQRDVAVVAKLEKDLEQTRNDFKEALSRVAERKLELDRMRESMAEKDEQIESLTCEVAAQIEEVQHLQARLSIQDHDHPLGFQSSTGGSTAAGAMDDGTVDNLLEENETMKAELAITLERASEMVKERDRTIDSLKNEREALHQLMDIRDSSGTPRDETAVALKERQEEVQLLKDQIKTITKESQEIEQAKQILAEDLQHRDRALQDLMKEYEELEVRVKRAEKNSKRTKGLLDKTEDSLTEMRQQVEKLRGHQKATTRELDEATMLVNERDDALTELLGEYEALKREPVASIADLRQQQDMVLQKENQVQDLEQAREVLQQQLQDLRLETRSRQEDLECQLESLQNQKDDLKARLVQSTEALQSRETAIEDMVHTIEGLKRDQLHSHSERTELEEEQKRSLVDYLREIDELKLQTVETNRRLEQARGMIQEREAAIADLLKEIDDMKHEHETVNTKDEAETNRMELELQEKSHNIENFQLELQGMTRAKEGLARQLERKTDMVKEREEVIEELLKEIEGLKKQQNDAVLELGEATDLVEERAEELTKLRQERTKLLEDVRQGERSMSRMQEEMNDLLRHEEEKKEVQGALEDLQRDHAIVNEDLEERILREGEMEANMQRLQNELEAWKEKAINGEQSNKVEAADQQALFLEKAMANRKKKEEAIGDGWFGYAAKLLVTGAEAEEDLDPNQRRIKELEEIQKARDAEIDSLRRELIQIQTKYREESYINKKKMESLEIENAAYKKKVESLKDKLRNDDRSINSELG